MGFQKIGSGFLWSHLVFKTGSEARGNCLTQLWAEEAGITGEWLVWQFWKDRCASNSVSYGALFRPPVACCVNFFPVSSGILVCSGIISLFVQETICCLFKDPCLFTKPFLVCSRIPEETRILEQTRISWRNKDFLNKQEMISGRNKDFLNKQEIFFSQHATDGLTRAP